MDDANSPAAPERVLYVHLPGGAGFRADALTGAPPEAPLDWKSAWGDEDADQGTVFSLAHSGVPGGGGTRVGDHRVVPVLPSEGFGSQELAEVTDDFNATVRALAENPVALPVAFDDYGRLRLVAHRREDEDFLRLSVYSTSAAVHADLQQAGPLFIIRHGASVIRFLDEHSERILFVTVDPASCLRPIEFPASLPQYFATMPPPRRTDRREEDSAWGAGAAPGEGAPPTGFVLDLSDDWVRVDLTVGAEALKTSVDGLIAEQTRQWPTTMGWLRERTRGWLQRTCLQAKSSGGVEFAVLMNSTKSREPTLTLVNYWLALPRTADGPLVHVRDFLGETADDDDEIAIIETRARRLLRSVRVRPAARRGGAAPEQEMLLIDYWIEVPGDPASAARVVFTRPGADSRDEVVAQCDAIIRSGRWDAPGAQPA